MQGKLVVFRVYKNAKSGVDIFSSIMARGIYMPRYKVTLTDKEQEELKKLIQKGDKATA